ncbi:DegV family EDD domain-containing protein [Clostridium thermobutyricum]|uniref:DegV family EDD domain-containing protein n=1 Tax=Clostridium thermobutyricum TaxID=29372 RepID=N9XL18_9CLOT|nr:DegV family protein [Clostridium thermobutyricum]ENZ00388.1 DegV family EDD domain-containing protein [Clostridium thermobutyricum]
MQKIALVTDSGSDLTLEELKENNIELVPFRIIYPEKEYNDVLEISPDDVYNRLKEHIPTTSLPSIDYMEGVLNRLEKEGYTHVIMISISSHFSGTGNSFRLLLEDHPNLTSFVFDSKTLSAPQGTLVLMTAKMIRDGLSFEEICEKLPVLRTQSHGYFTIDTLEYLKKGGRIGSVAGTIGSVLNIKPIIWVSDEGVYETYAKVRGQKQALSRLQKIAKQELDKYGDCDVTVLSGGADDLAQKLYEMIKDFEHIKSIRFSKIGPALGVNTGPGTVGVSLQEVH